MATRLKPRDVRANVTGTVDRALKLLVAVLDGNTGGTMSELARATSLSPSTASRLLATIGRHGLIWRDENGRFQPGPRIQELAAATLRAEPLYELVRPHLEELVRETGESASLGVPSSTDRVLYLRQVPSAHQVQMIDWTGLTIPRKNTALGSALDGLASTTGYLTSSRPDSDVTAVAVPIRDSKGRIPGAISINAPTYRTSEADIERYGLALLRHAAEISAKM
jgi:DNA-binding IclR family transcriptional regulator